MTAQTLIDKIIIKLKYHHLLDWMPDKQYLELMYWTLMHRKLDLQNPQSFNEKLQWLKLYDRNPDYTHMVDKYEAKKYVADRIGERYIIPTLGVWDSFDEIDFEALPNQFVLKCTHDSGGLVICKDKSKLDLRCAREKLEKSLKTDYYLNWREWPYKNVKPRIIAEKYMEDNKDKELRDYKIYCFNGKMKMLLVVQDRGIKATKGDYFDEYYHHLDLTWGFPHAEQVPDIPDSIHIMRELAEILSKGLPEVRVDFYYANGKVYFGEMTFFDGSGFEKIEPYDWDLKLGSWVDIESLRK